MLNVASTGRFVMLRNIHQVRRGFTLAEILVVVVILGLVSAVVVPQIGSRSDLRCAAGARPFESRLNAERRVRKLKVQSSKEFQAPEVIAELGRQLQISRSDKGMGTGEWISFGKIPMSPFLCLNLSDLCHRLSDRAHLSFLQTWRIVRWPRGARRSCRRGATG